MTANSVGGPALAVIGVGRTGVTTAVGLASLGWRVAGVDESRERLRVLASGRLPEAEPGLRCALSSVLAGGGLTFTTHLEPRAFDVALICVDTPPLPSGAANLQQVLSATETAASALGERGTLVTRSTVPVGTGERLEAELAGLGRADVEVVHVPEFLREGHAWEDFIDSDRVVIGGAPSAVARISELFQPLGRPLFAVDRRTAELAKYVNNAFLATSVSFANEMAGLADALGADGQRIFDILRSDRRIGRLAYLTPGLGFGGHCLPKDTVALDRMASSNGLTLRQLQATIAINQTRGYEAAGWLRRMLGGLDGQRICIGGLAFKAGTDDLRLSPSLHLAAALLAEGAQVSAWDPHVIAPIANVQVCQSLSEAAAGVSAVVIGQAWDGWRELDPALLRAVMARRVIYDAPGSLDGVRWSEAGFVTNHSTPREPVAIHAQDTPMPEKVFAPGRPGSP